jgi:hypothetical protein
MGSFRNQLLALIIGLIIVTQSVTLIAVLARVEGSVAQRATEQLASGSNFIEQLLRFRAAQLASAVGVLAQDFGFREAVASGDKATMQSAADNHMRRIGADLMLLTDRQGKLLTSTMPIDADTGTALHLLIDGTDMVKEHPHVIAVAGRAYQMFLAPVRAPENIGWVAMGFAVDDSLAKRLSDMTGAEISLISVGQGHEPFIASTLKGADRVALAATTASSRSDQRFDKMKLGEHEYLSVSRKLPSSPDVIEMIVLRSVHEVMGPYRDVRDAMLVLGTIAVVLAAGIGLLAGRNVSRPVAALVQAARRIEDGHYDHSMRCRPVSPSARRASRISLITIS